MNLTQVPSMRVSTFTGWISGLTILILVPMFMYFNSLIVEPLKHTNDGLVSSTTEQHGTIDSLGIANAELQRQISELKTPTSYGVRLTNYYPVEAQCDSSPLITASGAKIIKDEATDHRWIAISWDLHTKLSKLLPEDDPRYGKGTFEMGDYVRLTGYGQSVDGIYQIQDTMNKRHRMAIDRLTNVDSPLEFAENVTITKVFIPELHEILEAKTADA